MLSFSVPVLALNNVVVAVELSCKSCSSHIISLYFYKGLMSFYFINLPAIIYHQILLFFFSCIDALSIQLCVWSNVNQSYTYSLV